MDFNTIKKDMLFYSFANTLSISLFSNFGVQHTIANEIVSDFVNKLLYETRIRIDENNINKERLNSIFKNVKPLLGIYSTYNISDLEASNIKSKSLITLNDKNINKLISPKNQGLLIINKLNLINFLYKNNLVKLGQISTHEEKLLSLVLLYSVIEQVKFIEKYLKNSKGFYISRLGDFELLQHTPLEDLDNSIDFEDQAYMLLAFSRLYETMKKEFFLEFFPYNNAKEYKILGNNLFLKLHSKESDLIDVETHKLTGIISCISSCYNIIDNLNSYKYLLLSLSDELCSREVNNGFLLKYKGSNIPASLATHFAGINSLIDSYSYLNFYFLLDIAKKVYSNVEGLWNDELGLFKIKNNGKIKYTAKNIAFGLKALLKLAYYIENHEKKEGIMKQLNIFFESTVTSTGLQISPDFIPYDHSTNERISSYSSIPEFLKDCKGFMVLKGFKLYHKKDRIIIDKKFDCEHALLINDAMFQLYSNIDSDSL